MQSIIIVKKAMNDELTQNPLIESQNEDVDENIEWKISFNFFDVLIFCNLINFLMVKNIFIKKI